MKNILMISKTIHIFKWEMDLHSNIIFFNIIYKVQLKLEESLKILKKLQKIYNNQLTKF